MGKPTGFLEYNRETAKVLPPKVRIANFNEFRTPLSKEKQKLQGARCMACGVPFCQSGMMLGGMASGCPLHNLVPETNDLVYTGNWKQAYLRLSKTHSFPEFTSRVCLLRRGNIWLEKPKIIAKGTSQSPRHTPRRCFRRDEWW